MSFFKKLFGIDGDPTPEEDEIYLQHCVNIVRKSVDDLGSDRLAAINKVSFLEENIKQLREYKPNHPLISEAIQSLNDYLKNRFSVENTPPLLSIGSTELKCPYCSAEFEKLPIRAAKCKQCGQKYYSRKRPLDDERVLLREDELSALEEEWGKDYKFKQMQPRDRDPVWDERMRIALTTERHEDPAVEDAATTVFNNAIDRIMREDMSPRDAFDFELDKFEGDFKKQVEIRVWQLQIRSMGGPG